jgi:16S rRNA (guanine966-N2)-methyltransferase
MVKRSNAESAPRGSVRIIAGTWRGRRIPVVDGTTVRPTPDRVRETVFNWLREIVVGARCLDLFAGTGALGFEALSRGAGEVWFVESDARLVAALRAQAAAFGAATRITRGDVAAFLDSPPATRFDVVFLDPPYAEPVDAPLAGLRPWLAAGAVVYVERPRGAQLRKVEGGEWWKRARAGGVEFGLVRFQSAQ